MTARRRRGLTLIEVVIAIALILALVGGMYGFLFELIDTRRQAGEIGDRQRAATLLIDRLESDLLCAIAGGGPAGAGVVGDTASIAVLSRGVPVFAAGEPPAVALADLERTRYRFRGGAIEARRDVVAEGGESGGFESLGAQVAELRFRFHDGEEWRDDFHALRAGRLPAAVEVSIWFEPWEEEGQVGDGGPEEDADLDGEPWLEPGDPDEGDEWDAARRDFGAELEALDRPAPDRRRVIVIPDAAPDGDDAADDDLVGGGGP